MMIVSRLMYPATRHRSIRIKNTLINGLGVLLSVVVALGLLTAIVYPLALASCGNAPEQRQAYEDTIIERVVTARINSVQLAPYDTAIYELSNGYKARGSTSLNVQVGVEYRLTLRMSKGSEDKTWYISKISVPD